MNLLSVLFYALLAVALLLTAHLLGSWSFFWFGIAMTLAIESLINRTAERE
jgi:hypothetical protein